MARAHHKECAYSASYRLSAIPVEGMTDARSFWTDTILIIYLARRRVQPAKQSFFRLGKGRSELKDSMQKDDSQFSLAFTNSRTYHYVQALKCMSSVSLTLRVQSGR